MSHKSFGHLFRFTTWGESHGPALGCVVDGCPPGLAVSEAEVQAFLDKRKPGQSKYTNLRRALVGVIDLLGVYWLLRRTNVGALPFDRDGDGR